MGFTLENDGDLLGLGLSDIKNLINVIIAEREDVSLANIFIIESSLQMLNVL